MAVVLGVPLFLLGPVLFLIGRTAEIPVLTVFGLFALVFGLVCTATGVAQMVRAWLRKPAA